MNELLEDFRRRCAPRDKNDHLFVIPIAEVRQLIELCDKLVIEMEEWKGANSVR